MKSKRLLSVIAALLALSMIMTAALMSSCSNKTGGGGTSTADAGTTGAPTSDTAKVPTVEQPQFKYSGKRLTTSRVSVHDPSIVYEPDSGKYYLFGSHKAWAVSDDLASWKTFTIPSLEVNNASLFAPNIAICGRPTSSTTRIWANGVCICPSTATTTIPRSCF